MKNVLIIGHAGYLLQHEIGHLIDSFGGEVVRLNDFIIEGFEKYIGTRCDWWFCAPKDFHNKYDTKHKISVCYTLPPWVVDTNKKNEAEFIGFDTIEAAKDALGFGGPTTGFLAVFYFLIKDYNVFIHGFDHYADKKNIYYHMKMTKWDYQTTLHCHRPGLEKIIFDGLINQGKIKVFHNETSIADK